MTLPDDLNRAWSDPGLQQAAEALISGDPTPAYELLAAGSSDPERRCLRADVLGEVGARHLPPLREAAGDDAHWSLLWGSAMCHAAWSARGSATMDHTAENQVRRLFELGKESRRALRRSAERAPGDPAPWTVLQTIVKATATGRPEADEVWESLRRIAPDSFMGNHQRLSILCRKWYGSTEEMLAFMRERCATLPDGHPLWSLAPQAHIEVWVDGHMTGNLVKRIYRATTYGPLKKRAVLAEVGAASDRMLAGAAAYAGHPWTVMAHQMFGAFYFKAGVRERARVHLELGGDRSSIWPWGYFGGAAQDELAGARKAAGL